MKNEKDPVSFNPDLIGNSLPPKPPSSPPEPPCRETGPSRPKRDKKVKDVSEDYRQMMSKISKKLGIRIEQIDNARLLQKLNLIAIDGMESIPESPLLSKVLKEVDKKLEGHKFLKHFASKSVKYLWIAARKVVPNWEGVEMMLNGYIDDDPNKVFKGVLRLTPGGEVTTRLYQLIEEQIE